MDTNISSNTATSESDDRAAKPKAKRRMARPAAEPTSSPDSGEATTVATATATAISMTPRAGSKAAGVIALLGRAQGATMAELIEATGWLAHTTRAALTGLRKKGHAIERFRRGDDTCYRITEAA